MGKQADFENDDLVVLVARFLVSNDYFKAAKALMLESKLKSLKPVSSPDQADPQEKAGPHCQAILAQLAQGS